MFSKLRKRPRARLGAEDSNAYVEISKPTDRSGDTNISVLYNGRRKYFSKISDLRHYLSGNDFILRAKNYSTKKYLSMYGIKNSRLQ